MVLNKNYVGLYRAVGRDSGPVEKPRKQHDDVKFFRVGDVGEAQEMAKIEAQSRGREVGKEKMELVFV